MNLFARDQGVTVAFVTCQLPNRGCLDSPPWRNDGSKNRTSKSNTTNDAFCHVQRKQNFPNIIATRPQQSQGRNSHQY